MSLLLWVAFPYVALASLVGGTVWRYRYDRFGWTTRSSELYEKRLLRVASPLFHYGLLFVIGGHALGLLIPEQWTSLVGSETTYHAVSLYAGTAAGLAAGAGLVLLVYRRRRTGPVFAATTRNDKVMYLLLGGALLLGIGVTTIENGLLGGYDYRQTVSPWFRGIFLLDPRPELMEGAPLLYRFHVVLGFALIALFPFTRLIHAFAVPVKYPFRPYIVYRRRTGTAPATRAARRGWEPVSRD
ncbi:respiratory nitrate reductase subunit gamma [Actinomadura flavalba]|uniref:respiratory nitrate reductase subunit gamma n=1 Tax=Actinomadura flavalba TaxID=1120938 RepID=UPI00036FD718|nr:respiratory nitrate reductase subunit gamma [Actinomadura flavalba]